MGRWCDMFVEVLWHLKTLNELCLGMLEDTNDKNMIEYNGIKLHEIRITLRC